MRGTFFCMTADAHGFEAPIPTFVLGKEPRAALSTWDLTALLNAADPATPAARAALVDRARAGVAAPGTPNWPTRPSSHLRRCCACARCARCWAASGTPRACTGPAGRLSARHRCRHLAGRLRLRAARLLRQRTDRRLRAKAMPGTPDTRNLAELFDLIFRVSDERWIARIDDLTLRRLAALWPSGPTPWSRTVLDAVNVLCSAVQAAGFSAPLRPAHEPRRARARTVFANCPVQRKTSGARTRAARRRRLRSRRPFCVRCWPSAGRRRAPCRITSRNSGCRCTSSSTSAGYLPL